MPLILYMHPFSPPVRAVLLTTETLNLKVQEKLIDLNKKEHLQPEFLKRNSQHTIPVLDDNGTVIWESHAIMAYLVRKYAKNDALYPKDFAARALVDQRLHFNSGVIFPQVKRIVRGFRYKGHKTVQDEDRAEIISSYEFLEGFLTGRKWIAGESVTIADFSLIPTVTSVNYLIRIDETQFPNIIRWIKQAEQWSHYNVNATGLIAYKKLIKSLISS